jgi:hypothetical protein
MPINNDNEKIKKLLKEDLAKSLTHDRQEPDTSPPTIRVTSQDKPNNTQQKSSEDKK